MFKWQSEENVNSFCSNQHVSLVQNADEIIGRNLSAFSSVKISNNSANRCVAVEPSITNVGRIDEDAASEMQIQGDEVPVWTYRGATDAGAVKTKGYDLKKELLKNQIPANLNTGKSLFFETSRIIFIIEYWVESIIKKKCLEFFKISSFSRF